MTATTNPSISAALSKPTMKSTCYRNPFRVSVTLVRSVDPAAPSGQTGDEYRRRGLLFRAPRRFSCHNRSGAEPAGEGEVTVDELDDHLLTIANLTGQELERQRIEQVLLDHPLEGTSAERGIVA